MADKNPPAAGPGPTPHNGPGSPSFVAQLRDQGREFYNAALYGPQATGVAVGRSAAVGDLRAVVETVTLTDSMEPKVIRPPGVPELLLQAVVTMGERTDEGQVIQSIAPPWYAFVALMEKDPNSIYQIHWRRWEEIVAGAYKADGWDVILTPRSGDRGCDVIASRSDIGSIKIYDQVKAYSPGTIVPAVDVSSIHGTLLGLPNVSKGVVTTTSKFAPGVYEDPRIKPFLPNRLELRDGKQLVEWLKKIAALTK